MSSKGAHSKDKVANVDTKISVSIYYGETGTPSAYSEEMVKVQANKLAYLFATGVRDMNQGIKHDTMPPRLQFYNS